MYSKQEASQLKQEFWTAFGQYMAPVTSAEGENINWVNYKTGEKDILFRMQAENKKASISITLTHKDPEIQQIFFEQFLQVKKLFVSLVGSDWLWQMHTFDNFGRLVSIISTEREGMSIFKREDWPELISFFKTNMIALDSFWSEVKYGFESLR
jgi:hypothetical protein